MILHAGLIGRWRSGRWRGVLIEGPSGAGKSDLALRALAEGWSLVADDRVRLFVSGRFLWGTAPAPLAGLLETRGLGVQPAPALRFCRIDLLGRCVCDPTAVERIPQPRYEMLMGQRIPLFELWPRDGAATAKLGRALEALGGPQAKAYQPPLSPPGARRGP